MRIRDLQTFSLFAILAVLTFLFVMGSRAVLFAPPSWEQAHLDPKARVQIEMDRVLGPEEAKKGP